MIDESKVSSSPFRPGMSASVDIQTETGRNVLTVPIQAVTTRADTTGVVKEKKMADSREEEKDVVSKEKVELVEYVFLFDEGKAIMQKVKTGIQDDMYIQIIEGLNEGDEVITGPYRAVSKKLKNGDEVIKVEKKDLFKKEK
jgi:HlyD family secretion protein